MTSDGYVIVAKQLPRLRLYNTGKAVLGIDVHDTGNPSLLTQVTAEIEVESKSSISSTKRLDQYLSKVLKYSTKSL